MDSQRRRALIETLKYLNAKELLQVSSTSHLWHSITLEDEVWLPLLPQKYLPASRSVPARTVYREVHCSFVLSVLDYSFVRYHFSSQHWSQTPLRPSSPHDYLDSSATPWVDRNTTMVYLGNNTLFACGGPGGTSDTVKIDIVLGDMIVMQGMKKRRQFPGAVVEGGCVYALCGWRNGPVNDCERFRLEGGCWESLPKATVNRSTFHPVVYRSLIYLSGGYSRTVESFDPASLSFSLHPFSTPIETSSSSLVHNGKLLTISENCVYSWDFSSAPGTSTPLSGKTGGGWSQLPLMRFDGEVAWLSFDQSIITFLDLNTLQTRFNNIPRHSLPRKSSYRRV